MVTWSRAGDKPLSQFVIATLHDAWPRHSASMCFQCSHYVTWRVIRRNISFGLPLVTVYLVVSCLVNIEPPIRLVFYHQFNDIAISIRGVLHACSFHVQVHVCASSLLCPIGRTSRQPNYPNQLAPKRGSERSLRFGPQSHLVSLSGNLPIVQARDTLSRRSYQPIVLAKPLMAPLISCS